MQIVISGAVNGTFPVSTAWAANFPGDYSIHLNIDLLCNVVFDIPHETKPGTYDLVDRPNPQAGQYGAEYNDGCHNNVDRYGSTSGSLTLTATGATWSGSYKFTGQTKDRSKTAQVSGSFADIPINK